MNRHPSLGLACFTRWIQPRGVHLDRADLGSGVHPQGEFPGLTVQAPGGEGVAADLDQIPEFFDDQGIRAASRPTRLGR